MTPALFNDFETSFKVMVEDNPNNITDFRTGLINDVGADTAEAKRTYEIAIKGVELNERRVEEQDLLAEALSARARVATWAASRTSTVAMLARPPASSIFFFDSSMARSNVSARRSTTDGHPSGVYGFFQTSKPCASWIMKWTLKFPWRMAASSPMSVK